jgi:hypothetical protein
MSLTLSRMWTPLIAAAVAVVAIGAIAALALWTQPTRAAVQVYTEILGAANRQDVEAARRLCSTRYKMSHTLRPAAFGGIVGLPRNIHQNFQVWRDGPNVLLCPTNRVGPVYQFVRESGAWKFDGPIGVLQGRGQLARFADGDLYEPPAPAPNLD